MENSFAQELMKRIEEIYTGYGLAVRRIPGREGKTEGLQMIFVLPKKDDGKKGEVSATGMQEGGGAEGKPAGLPQIMEVIPFSLDKAEIMQYYIYIHSDVKPDELEKIRPFLYIDNMMRPYGHFGFLPSEEDESGLLYYRQDVMMLHEDGLEHAVKQFEHALDYIFVMLSDSVFGLLDMIGKLPDNLKEKEEPGEREENTEDRRDFRFCTNCGMKLRADAVFCTSCGTKLQ